MPETKAGPKALTVFLVNELRINDRFEQLNNWILIILFEVELKIQAEKKKNFIKKKKAEKKKKTLIYFSKRKVRLKCECRLRGLWRE